METKPSLKSVLKRLRLSGILSTLPDRVVYARKTKLEMQDFLEPVIQEEQTLEGFDWDAPITFDRDRVRQLLSLAFLEAHEDVIVMGPVGVGKTHLAAALGHAACRSGRDVLMIQADLLLRELLQSRADRTTSKTMRKFISPDLLILDDFGLRRLDALQSSDLYELIIERHKQASTLFTSYRGVEEWVPLFDDPILAQSALDRLAHNAHQGVVEGDSYRKRQGPGTRNASRPKAQPAAKN